MRLTFPRMGTLHIGLAAVVEALGHRAVVPPPVTARTAALGARHAPETACLPCKLVLGSFLQATECAPVDGVLMAGGVGPCRFGCYHRIHRRLMRRLGHDWEWFVPRPPRGRLREVLAEMTRLRGRASVPAVWRALRLGWAKLGIAEEIESAVRRLHPREKQPGEIRRLRGHSLALVREAKDLRALREARADALDRLRRAARGRPAPDEVRVAVVGEIFTVLEPGANMHLEEALGRLGARVHRGLHLTGWAREHLLLDVLRWGGRGWKRRRAAAPYLRHFVGGEGRATVGRTVRLAGRMDGIIHVMPFTCGPEIVARGVLRAVRRDCGIPVLTLVFDEHTARTGVLTRLEAFVDMLRRQKGGERNR